MLGESIARAISSVFEFGKPILDRALAQKSNEDHKSRLEEWNRLELLIISAKDDYERAVAANRVDTFVKRLCLQAGSPIGGVGRNVAIPMDALRTFIAQTSESIMETEKLNAMEYKNGS